VEITWTEVAVWEIRGDDRKKELLEALWVLATVLNPETREPQWFWKLLWDVSLLTATSIFFLG
jgi:hypothetical protein